jgi:hypothetical protein
MFGNENLNRKAMRSARNSSFAIGGLMSGLLGGGAGLLTGMLKKKNESKQLTETIDLLRKQKKILPIAPSEELQNTLVR